MPSHPALRRARVLSPFERHQAASNGVVGAPWRNTSERAAPSQPGLDGDDNLVIGSVLKNRHHELDAGCDDGR